MKAAIFRTVSSQSSEAASVASKTARRESPCNNRRKPL